MAAAPLLIEERTHERGDALSHLERLESQAARVLEAHLQRLVERLSTLVGAPRASLNVLDLASQTLVTVAACTQRSSGPLQAPLRVHEALASWVTKQRTPAIITDGASDPRTRALGLIAVGSLLSVPLLAEQQMLGALTISSPSINAFKPPNLRLLEMVADLVALAICQARHLVAVAQPIRPPVLPLEVSGRLDATSDARALFGLAVSAIRQLVRCEEAVIFRYEAGTETLSGVAGLGIHCTRLADARIRVRDPHSVTAWVAQQRRPLLLAGGATGFIGRATETLLAERELALLAVPLVAYERLWGVITLARSAPFETSDLRTMLHLSQMLAPSLAQPGHAR